MKERLTPINWCIRQKIDDFVEWNIFKLANKILSKGIDYDEDVEGLLFFLSTEYAVFDDMTEEEAIHLVSCLQVACTLQYMVLSGG